MSDDTEIQVEADASDDSSGQREVGIVYLDAPDRRTLPIDGFLLTFLPDPAYPKLTLSAYTERLVTEHESFRATVDEKERRIEQVGDTTFHQHVQREVQIEMRLNQRVAQSLLKLLVDHPQWIGLNLDDDQPLDAE